MSALLSVKNDVERSTVNWFCSARRLERLSPGRALAIEEN